MNEEHTPVLPDHWRPPQRVLLEEKWDKHPEHERLVALSLERDEYNDPTWGFDQEPERDDPDWTVVWFRPRGLRDERDAIRIHRYPNKWLESETARVEDLKALDDDHLLD